MQCKWIYQDIWARLAKEPENPKVLLVPIINVYDRGLREVERVNEKGYEDTGISCMKTEGDIGDTDS